MPEGARPRVGDVFFERPSRVARAAWLKVLATLDDDLYSVAFVVEGMSGQYVGMCAGWMLDSFQRVDASEFPEVMA